MKKYKVIGNTSPVHHFQIGSIVTLRGAALTDDCAVFELANESNTTQIINMKDVEPVELTKQEGAVALSALVADINSKISEAEALADEHGLEFSLDVAYGMGGTYYGTADGWCEQGWNPSSQSC